MPGPTVSGSVRARVTRASTQNGFSSSTASASMANPAPTSTSASASGAQPAKYRPGKSSSSSGPLVSPACSTRCTGAPTADARCRSASANGSRSLGTCR